MPSQHQNIASKEVEHLSVRELKAERMNILRAARNKARADGTIRYEPIDGWPGQYFEVFSISR